MEKIKNNIIIENLSKVYLDDQRGQIKAVDELSLETKPGEIFGLLGPNGAGKTTTLRMLATLIKPNSGSAYVNGYSILENAEDVRKSIGFLSTTTALYPNLTPREIMDYFAKLNGYTKNLEARIEEVISYLGIVEFADTLIEKMSTGMKQISSIARAIVHDPPILILDEPSTGLDVMIASKMHDFIKDLKDQGKSIVFSSHNMGEVEKMCDRIGIINRGKLLTIGTMDQLREESGKTLMEDIFIHYVNHSGLNKTKGEVQ